MARSSNELVSEIIINKYRLGWQSQWSIITRTWLLEVLLLHTCFVS